MKIHNFDGIYQERWGFSWAMLVYQRVLQNPSPKKQIGHHTSKPLNSCTEPG